MRGLTFKRAGWRWVSLVGVWTVGEEEPLVVLSNLPLSWDLVAWYGERYWLECGFRTDKSHGWRWEQSQVQGQGHQERLRLGMAWATLVTWCVGVERAEQRLAQLTLRQPRRRAGRWVRGQPQHARRSVFSLGLERMQALLHRTEDGPIVWALPYLDAVAWNQEWRAAQAYPLIFETVRP